MQIFFSIESTNATDIILPFYYQHILQGIIYNLNDKMEFGKFLHDIGYKTDNRTYRLFSFSKILQKPKQRLNDKRQFIFSSRISWIVSTVENELIDSILKAAIEQNSIHLYGQTVKFTEIRILPIDIENPMRVRVMSPISAYSTIIMPNQKKRTIFYHPKETEFLEIIQRNLQRKCEAFYGEPAEKEYINIKVCSKPYEAVAIYKGFVTKGWTMELELLGTEKMINMALCAGLGGKNSQGFGLVTPKSQWEEIKKWIYQD